MSEKWQVLIKSERTTPNQPYLLGGFCRAGDSQLKWSHFLGPLQAYRFFDNDRVSEADILAGHFQATRERVVASDGPVLVLHDTTEFSCQREKPEAIGITCGRDRTRLAAS